MINNKKLNPIVTEPFITGRKLNISFVVITQSYFKVPKEVRLNTIRFVIMKVPNKVTRELQKIETNHFSDIDLKDFIKIYKKCTAKKYSFLVNDITSPSDNTLQFRINPLELIYNKTMTIVDQIKDKKLKYDINR